MNLTIEDSGNSETEGVEWIRVAQAIRLFGLSKPKLYELINNGAIRSVSLREKGQRRGTRLLCPHSVREYIESYEAVA